MTGRCVSLLLLGLAACSPPAAPPPAPPRPTLAPVAPRPVALADVDQGYARFFVVKDAIRFESEDGAGERTHVIFWATARYTDGGSFGAGVAVARLPAGPAGDYRSSGASLAETDTPAGRRLVGRWNLSAAGFDPLFTLQHARLGDHVIDGANAVGGPLDLAAGRVFLIDPAAKKVDQVPHPPPAEMPRDDRAELRQAYLRTLLGELRSKYPQARALLAAPGVKP